MSKVSLPKDKIRILLLEGVHQSAVETLNSNGYTNVEYLKTSLSEEYLIEKVKDVHFIGIRSRTQITEAVVQAAEKLVAVGCFCIGTNQVDLKATQFKTRVQQRLLKAANYNYHQGLEHKKLKSNRREISTAVCQCPT